jgi:uncharacterized protein YuzE
MKSKYLKGKGEVDYDYKYDTLFFKTANREYAQSIEADNIILDVDKKGFIVGMQILEASKFLNASKLGLLKVAQWKYRAKVHEGKIEIRLVFNIVIRNKIVEKNPIIMQPTNQSLPNSELVCTATA